MSQVIRRQNRGDQATGSVIKPVLCASNQIQLLGPHKSADSLQRRVTGAVIEPRPDCTVSKLHELKWQRAWGATCYDSKLKTLLLAFVKICLTLS